MKKIDFCEDVENLNIIHIFEYYDHPLFYIAQNSHLDNFLFYFIDDEPFSTWLVSQVSMNEISIVRNRQVGVKTFLNRLFKRKRLFKIHIDEGKILDDLTSVLTEDNIDSYDFPEDDFEVEFDYISNTDLQKQEVLTSEEPKYLKLIFKDEDNSHSIPASVFKSVIANLEDYINYTTKHLNQESKIPSLNLLALPASSFGAEFEVILEEEIDLDQISSKVTQSLVSFIGELDLVNEKELSDQIFIEERFTPKQVKAIQKITEDAIDSGYDLIVETQDKDKNPIASSDITRLNRGKINKIDTALRLNNRHNSEIVEIDATVVAVNLKSKVFWLDISDLDDKSKFENRNDFHGKIDDELLDKLKDNNNPITINVPSKILARIKIDTIFDFTLPKTKDHKYSLLSFSE